MHSNTCVEDRRVLEMVTDAFAELWSGVDLRHERRSGRGQARDGGFSECRHLLGVDLFWRFAGFCVKLILVLGLILVLELSSRVAFSGLGGTGGSKVDLRPKTVLHPTYVLFQNLTRQP